MMILRTTAILLLGLCAISAAAQPAPQPLPPAYGYPMFVVPHGPVPPYSVIHGYGHDFDSRREAEPACAPPTTAGAIDWCALPPYRPKYAPQTPVVAPWGPYRP